VQELVPGMELGQAVYSGNGMAWLVEGTTLNSEMIRRLVNLGLETVVIREYHTVQVDIPKEETVIKPPLEFVIAPSALQARVDNEYETVLISVRRLFSMLRLKRAIDPTLLSQITDQIFQWSSRGAFIANFLLLAAKRSDYPVQHSVHVAAISGVIGNLLELPEQELKELVLCGLVHDIGFLPDSDEALLGSSPPDQMENARSHPVKGFKILQSCSFIPQRVLHGVLQHHERCDGSGYPLGVGQAEIHRFAKIIGLADTYESLNSSRGNAEALSPFLVMPRLRDEMMAKLDPVSCTAFLEYLTKVMIGNIVLLSDGAKAQVVYWRSSDPQPVVRNDNGQFIDLSKQQQISIVKIIGA
jgi:HD-GYP domain-containing protein (c-di-GMP phosphodiesterase class II)